LGFELNKMKEAGALLFERALNGPVRDLFYDCQREANEQRAVLRLLLSLDDSVSDLPWELLYSQDEFIAFNPRTPIVHYEPGGENIGPLRDQLPLRILVAVASPQGDVTHAFTAEKDRLVAALEPLRARGLLEVTLIEGRDSWRHLRDALEPNQTHIVHFVTFDVENKEKVLVMEDAGGHGLRIGSEQLRLLLEEKSALRLFVLSGQLQRNFRIQPSVADDLLNSGIPSAIAIRHQIGDGATQELFRSLYSLLAMSMPVDAAVTQARRKLFAAAPDGLEWAAPVLSTRVANCILFDFAGTNRASDTDRNFEIVVKEANNNEYVVHARCGERTAQANFINPFDDEQRHQLKVMMARAATDWSPPKIEKPKPRPINMPKIGSSRRSEEVRDSMDDVVGPVGARPQLPLGPSSPATPPPRASEPATTQLDTSMDDLLSRIIDSAPAPRVTRGPASTATQQDTGGTEPETSRPGDYSLEGWAAVMYRRGLNEMEGGDWPRAISSLEEVLSVMKARRSSGYRDAEELLAICRRNLTPSQPQPPYLDENVQFTVYKPKKIKPAQWYDMLAYAHLSEARPGSGEPDPVEQMKDEARRILGEVKIHDYSPAGEASSQAVPQMGEITFVPFMPGVDFNPRSSSFLWEESVHGEKFRIRASAALDGKTARGRMSVFLGSILLAEINLTIQVDSVQAPAADRAKPELETSARPFRNIFPSYSHDDTDIVAQIEQYAQLTGDKYLRDVNQLRSGQNWKRWMQETVLQADIFQLFWSTNSMRSENVRLEWEHALSLRRPDFIRPTYWEDPFPELAEENLPPPELKDLYFQPLRILTKTVGAEAAKRERVNASRGSDQRASLEKDPEDLRRLEEAEARQRAREAALRSQQEAREVALRMQREAEERQEAERRRMEQAESQRMDVVTGGNLAFTMPLLTGVNDSGETEPVEFKLGPDELVFWSKQPKPCAPPYMPAGGRAGPSAIVIGLGIGLAILGVIALVILFVLLIR
jgi:CHAT domain-containing protein/TIR domain-containing protein